MIMTFDREVDEILTLLGVEHGTMSAKDSMALAVILVKVYDRGMGFERNRVTDIVQRHAMSPMPLVEKIRKPVR